MFRSKARFYILLFILSIIKYYTSVADCISIEILFVNKYLNYDHYCFIGIFDCLVGTTTLFTGGVSLALPFFHRIQSSLARVVLAANQLEAVLIVWSGMVITTFSSANKML